MVLVFLVVLEVLCHEPAACAGGGQQERQGRGEAGLHPPARGVLCQAQGGLLCRRYSVRSKSIPTFLPPVLSFAEEKFQMNLGRLITCDVQ
jgi:hypothetical protein